MSVGDSLVLSDLQFLINVQYPMLDTRDQNGFLRSEVYITLPNFNEVQFLTSPFIIHIAI